MNKHLYARFGGAIAGVFLGVIMGYVTTGVMGDMASIPPTGQDQVIVYGFAVATAAFGFFHGKHLLYLAEEFFTRN